MLLTLLFKVNLCVIQRNTTEGHDTLPTNFYIDIYGFLPRKFLLQQTKSQIYFRRLFSRAPFAHNKSCDIQVFARPFVS